MSSADMSSVTEFLSNIGHYYTEILYFIGAVCYIATHYMKTMVPLRISGIAANTFFVTYGLLHPSYLTLTLYLIILILNSIRLYEMLELIKKVRTATQGDLSMDWLKPFMSKRSYRKGDILFHKGDAADEMFYTLSGGFRVVELNLDIPPGRIIGELGFLTPDNRRTQTVECTEDGHLLSITYEKVTELYFQNPTFGFYFLRLTSERMLQNIARLENTIATMHAASAQTRTPV